MPFVALDQETKRRIDITRYEDPRRDIAPGSIVCPLCNQDFVIVQGFIVTHHFRHKIECTSDYQSHPESIEHLRTKLIVSQNASAWFGKFTDATPELEVPIPEANRVADILFSFPNGWRVACEVQLASITIEQLERRTKDYLRAGVDVLWFLGKSAATPANIEWCIENFRGCLFLDYNTSEIKVLLTPEPIKL